MEYFTNLFRMYSSTGGKLKETGLAHWAYPNTGATNESGFTALPGGMRFPQGSVDIRQEGYWWAASSDIIEIATPGLYYNRSDFNFAGGSHGDSINGCLLYTSDAADEEDS